MKTTLTWKRNKFSSLIFWLSDCVGLRYWQGETEEKMKRSEIGFYIMRRKRREQLRGLCIIKAYVLQMRAKEEQFLFIWIISQLSPFFSKLALALELWLRWFGIFMWRLQHEFICGAIWNCKKCFLIISINYIWIFSFLTSQNICNLITHCLVLFQCILLKSFTIPN